LARHQRSGGGNVGTGAESDLDLDRGLRPDGQAVAYIAHVDAAVLRGRAGIEEGELQKAVARLGIGERDADDTARTFAVKGDRRRAAVVDQHFDAAPRLVCAYVIECEHEA